MTIGFAYVKNSSLFLLLMPLLLTSCIGVRNFRHDSYQAREKDQKAFVQTVDGQIIEASEAVMKAPLFGKATIQLDRETKIPVKEVMAYQNNTAYYRRLDGQFVPRIKKGPVNMYMKTETYQEYNGASGMNNMGGGWRTRTRVVYLLQKGSDAPLVRFTPEVTKEYVKDFAPAMEFVDVYESNVKKYRTWSYINTAATLGGLGLMVAGARSTTEDKVPPAGYAGLGLFTGGIINGFVNKVRKGKNIKNLELAIDTYNAQGTKSNRR
jgi:hypothetical protein